MSAQTIPDAHDGHLTLYYANNAVCRNALEPLGTGRYSGIIVKGKTAQTRPRELPG